jgi:hypothetical protein
MKAVTALVSARITNLMARRFPAVGRRATARQVARYRSSGGRKSNTIVGRPVFLLTWSPDPAVRDAPSC